MSSGVFDSSVLLAIAKEEPLSGNVLDILPSAVISTVNLAEVLSKVVELGLTHQANLNRLIGFLEGVVPLTKPQAYLIGELRAPTRHAGLSLGIEPAWRWLWNWECRPTQPTRTGCG